MLKQINHKLSGFRLRHIIKGKFALIAMLLFINLSACNLIFTPDEVGLAQLKTEDDYENAINGVYSLLTASLDEQYNFVVNAKGDDLSVQFAHNFNYVPTERSYKDNLFDSISHSCVDSRRKLNIPDQAQTKIIWIELYKVITSANNLINQYSENNKNENIRTIVGEAFLIRAYCYFRLTRIYGEVPIIEDTEVDYTISKSTNVEIYEFIEYNLLKAQELLPKNNSSARIPMVTPHKGTALAIKAELYLSWAGYPIKDESKYALAASTAEMVIDNMDGYGMGLMDDFADLWERENLYNKESVLPIFYPQLSEVDKRFHINYLFQGDFYPEILHSNSYGYFSTEFQFYNNYPKNYRRDITFFNTIQYLKYTVDEANESYNVDTMTIYLDRVEPCREIGYRKFFYDVRYEDYDQDISRSQKFWGSQRLDIFRFAHTLLTYAEAAARSGQLDAKAYDCVNMIRRRANHLAIHAASPFDIQQGLSPDVFADSVVWERAWELAGEPEGRWFDLVRLEMAENLPQLKGINDDDFPFDKVVSKGDYYYQIPEGDINLNPNLGE